MPNYTIEEKESFIVLGFGTELKSDYTDYMGINKEKADFWHAVNQDGRLDTLRTLATKVQTEETLPEATRVIQFPKGDYVVVKGEAPTAEELVNTVTGIAFGQVLQEATDYAYVGGPNTAVVMGQQNGQVYGEMWIPVIKK